MSARRSSAVAIGNFFFRYRNGAFPAVFAVTVLTLRPAVLFGNPSADRLLIRLGILVAIAGGLIRLLTIGYDYIDRGGKNKQVYASRLVHGGVYGITRNPMYVGNLLIAIGMTMVTGAPLAYLLIIPLFLCIYLTIIAAEEAYLRQRFGRDYEAYCAQVNRFLPAVRRIPQSFSGLRYDWRRAIRKDLGTITGLLLGLILFPVWRIYFLQGFHAAKHEARGALLAAVGVLFGYWFLHALKKRGRFFYTTLDTPSTSR